MSESEDKHTLSTLDNVVVKKHPGNDNYNKIKPILQDYDVCDVRFDVLLQMSQNAMFIKQ